MALTGPRHARSRRVGLAACGLVLAHLSCSAGVEWGASVMESLFGTGDEETAPAARAGPPSPTAVAPAPPRPLPADALYGHAVLARMRAIDSRFKRGRVWDREFEERRVAGDGRVRKVRTTDFYGAVRTELWLAVDDDDEVDIIVNFMNLEMQQLMGVGEGSIVWYDGTLKRYEQRLMVAGEWLEPLW